MRALTIAVNPEGGFHPANDALAEEAAVTRVALHHFQLLDDGTVVLLYELRGDLDRAKQILEGNSMVHSCEISGSTTGLAFIRAVPKRETRMLLEIPALYGLAVDRPIEHTRSGGVRVTVVGEEPEIRRFLADIPERIDVTVERVQPYERTSLQDPAVLTDRQHEIAEVAYDAGYYETPRQASQRELATRLDVSAATVGEHLRKIEQRLVERYLE